MVRKSLPWLALAVLHFGCLQFSCSTFATEPSPTANKSIVFIAGGPSHDYGSHEHYAGSKILAEVVERTDSNIKCQVLRNGWPSEDSVLDKADAIVIYSDGGGGHPALAHLPRLKKQMDRGAGLVCIHYAVEVPKEKGGPEFLEWLGGYFETHWSVNPHWDGKFDALPVHPITSGVKPFTTRDEWYFHMRFPEGMKGVTPILSAVPPASTMNRPDGPHSGNPTVREEVAKGLPQHVAWATERSNGGRSFGYTGGHFHWNWGRTEPTKLVANAILWTAKADVPSSGAAVEPMSVQQLKENQDESVPGNFDAKGIAENFKLISQTERRNSSESQPKLLFSSDTLTSRTPDHRVNASVDVRGVKRLYLIVTPGRDGFSCDWADWVEPKLSGPKGDLSLLDLTWTSANSQWGEVHKNASADGGPLKVNKQLVRGIGTHAESVVVFDLPAGYETFSVGCGLDDGGAFQQNGNATSVRFHIAAEGIPAGLKDWGRKVGPVDNASHDPAEAAANLDVPSDLQATLAASEPILKSLTNIDIDHRGRIWACEVVNYRGHNNDRPEGDRILILEDTDQDGIADSTKVFYQGRDVDSAMGICVLDNRILVSASPYLIEFVDRNGDDIPDEKNILLSKTGQPQHDHSLHSFLFGPDGKLYFNFGNTGQRLCDANGKPLVDRWGREINDSAKPYRQGMVFRCNEDLSDMEVLGHNFRNNYEATVDSFGTIWQSDNDDDGNRATRINYVMEFGNYGFVDEMTGAGWQADRTNLESEIPLRHWHLNDPGVVPNVLITGAGSPTGIAFYEGNLLPKRFHNQPIHADAGPNAVRAYLTRADGAGYTATIENIAIGERDRWFRPADVSVAPDGSLFLSDWYDPGVGGHGMGDIERGRLFRIAPPHSKYETPRYDFATAEGATAALQNPNHSVRYKAFKSLLSLGPKATPALRELTKSENPRYRARAYWLLAKVDKALPTVSAASRDSNADVRATAVRIARQHQLPVSSYFQPLLQDPSPVVLRELCIALREDRSEDGVRYWSELANRYDGKDRWYLEALGIAAMDRWDACLNHWLTQSPDLKTMQARDIVWRSRAQQSTSLLLAIASDKSTPPSELPKLLRALDFQPPKTRTDSIQNYLEQVEKAGSSEVNLAVLVELMMRAESMDIQRHPKLAELAVAFVQSLGTDPSQLKIVQKLGHESMEDLLFQRAIQWGTTTAGVQAVEWLATRPVAKKRLLERLSSEKASEEDIALGRIASLSNRKDMIEIQRMLLETATAPKATKVEAAIGLAKNKSTQPLILDLAKRKLIPAEALALVGASLRGSENNEVREQANQVFPALKTTQSELPPLEQLAKRRGNASNGKSVYFGAATCSQCHVVGNEGKNVGPNLSEIGDKLSKEAMYLAILAPSAAISHAYEAYAVRTDDDEVVTGLLVSQTEDSITLKDAKGIERTFDKKSIDEFKKQEKSLMPENLQELTSEQSLVDLVEYLTTLRK